MVYPELAHIDRLCNKCGRCVEVCELNAISVVDSGVKVDRSKCNSCGKCVEVCTPRALKIFGTEMSVEEAFAEVKRDELFYRNSGGGVTVSGGEPLLQPEFSLELLKRCQEAGLHTTLDTCGYVPPQTLNRLLPYIDLVLYDIKHMDTSVHEKFTGVPNEVILTNAKLVADNGIPVIVRIPLIPGFSDSEGDIEKIATFVSGLNGIGQTDILPYHRWGVGKYDMLDRHYELNELRSPSTEEVEKMKEIVESFGLRCEIGG